MIPVVSSTRARAWRRGTRSPRRHLHVFVVGLPAGMWQLRGSSLLLWDDMLPAPPDGLAEETLQVAVDALADLGEAL